jgi:hypothetical protein
MFRTYSRRWQMRVFLPLSLIAIGLASVQIGISIAAILHTDERLQPVAGPVSSPPPAPPVPSPTELGPALAAALKAGLSSVELWEALSKNDVDLGQGRRVFPSADLALVKAALESDALNVVVADSISVESEWCDESEPVSVAGWRCNDKDPQFNKVIKLTNGHFYKANGELIRSSDGAWSGKLDRILRLLATSELSPDLGRSLRKAQVIELMPGVDQAARALQTWIQQLDHWMATNSLSPHLENIRSISSILQSRHDLDGQVEEAADRNPQDGWIHVGEWNVNLEGLRFWHQVPSPTAGIVVVEGRFVPDDNGQFEVALTGTCQYFVSNRGESRARRPEGN